MTSTRNKNNIGNYNLDIKQNKKISNWIVSKNYYNTINLPGNGFNPCKFPKNVFSYNSTDIESFLFGINSCNLENIHNDLCSYNIKDISNNNYNFQPKLKCIQPIHLYEKPTIYMPAHHSFQQQRPLYLN